MIEEEGGEAVEVPHVVEAIEHERSYKWLIWVILAFVVIVIGIIIFVFVSGAEPASTGGIFVVDSAAG